MYHVKETVAALPGNLDLNVPDEDEFSPDKLRGTVERLYMTVIIGMVGFGLHMVRLRSWREANRTAAFCTAYFVAWFFDFLTPLFAVIMINLITYPPSRDYLFPPAPIALVNGKNGAPQKPRAGVLGSHDSATGAPENYKGEAVEMEASNFVKGIAQIALSSVTGKHPQNEPPSQEGGLGDSIPDPTAMALSAADARQSAGGANVSATHDKTKLPMEEAMWTKMRPIMHTLQDVADGWERFANALSPTPPFPVDTARLRLGGLMIPLLASGLFITSYMYMKGLTFGIGFGFFGDPVIQRGITLLNRNFPNWKKLLELRNTILKGVPTNAQLTLTLLRVGEANKAPIPPPPQTDEAPPNEAAHMSDGHLSSTGSDAPLGASQAEIDALRAHDPSTTHQSGGADIDASKEKKHGHKGGRMLGFFKSTLRTGVSTALGADRLKATIGSSHAKMRLGALPDPTEDLTSGPVDFNARYNAKKGHIYVVTNATIPCVSFSTDSDVEKVGSQNMDDDRLHPVWTIAIADIKELKKVGGFGWKAKLVVGWALDRQVADGMEIVDRAGSTWKITALPLRDELFNRLIAIGPQKWESW